jgi:transcription termination factor Rho
MRRVLDIPTHGIAQRHDDGSVTLHRPAKLGGFGTEIAVPAALADEWRIATGDIVTGVTEPIESDRANTALSDECLEDVYADEERDEPSALRGGSPPAWLVTRIGPTESLISVSSINGLTGEDALDRPAPRRRHATERSVPDTRLTMAVGPSDTTGRMLDFAAPLGRGYAGVIYGPHASGLTRTLRAVVQGVYAEASVEIMLVLLLRARGEEITDWRRRYPETEIVVCPTVQAGATPEQTLRVADLVLACAQRQTELGRHVLLAVDSLTGLWGVMLETEEADAQRHADQSRARQRIREWAQAAGNFGGEGLLGNAIGGSLTLVGTVWHQAIDSEAEEEGEIHPHLRLLEHLLHETSWRVPLSGELARARLYPTIDVTKCLSQREENLLDAPTYERLLDARRALSQYGLTERQQILLDALDTTSDLNELLDALRAAPPTE